MKSTGDRLGEAGKSKAGNFWNWIKGKMTDTYFFYIQDTIQVGTG